jgi:hypothetical protein
MNSDRKLLALRKEVLVARSSLLRLQAAADVQRLREGLRFGNVRTAIAAQPSGRKALFALLLVLAGSRQLARMVRVAAAAVAVAKAVTVVAQLVHRPTSAASSQSPEASS